MDKKKYMSIENTLGLMRRGDIFWVSDVSSKGRHQVLCVSPANGICTSAQVFTLSSTIGNDVVDGAIPFLGHNGKVSWINPAYIKSVSERRILKSDYIGFIADPYVMNLSLRIYLSNLNLSEESQSDVYKEADEYIDWFKTEYEKFKKDSMVFDTSEEKRREKYLKENDCRAKQHRSEDIATPVVKGAIVNNKPNTIVKGMVVIDTSKRDPQEIAPNTKSPIIENGDTESVRDFVNNRCDVKSNTTYLNDKLYSEFIKYNPRHNLTKCKFVALIHQIYGLKYATVNGKKNFTSTEGIIFVGPKKVDVSISDDMTSKMVDIKPSPIEPDGKVGNQDFSMFFGKGTKGRSMFKNLDLVTLKRIYDGYSISFQEFQNKHGNILAPSQFYNRRKHLKLFIEQKGGKV